MLDVLISSKLRIKLLLKFFINPELVSYLRGLTEEFNVSSNAIRQEIDKFEKAGIIKGHRKGNKKLFRVNTSYPLYKEIRNLMLKNVGLEEIVSKVIKKLGNIERVYLTGSLARGVEGPSIDLYLIGDFNKKYLQKSKQKAEKLIDRKIRIATFKPGEWDDELLQNIPHMLLYE